MKRLSKTKRLIIYLQEKPHEVFQRSGSDLMMKKTVTLTEALCGFTTVVDHLDGRKIVINHPPGSVLVPGIYRLI